MDLRFQYQRKSSRCQRSLVSGCTSKRACCQGRTSLANRTRRMRSVLVNGGRFTCRLRPMRGFRNRAFSATSSDLLLARSVRVPRTSLAHLRYPIAEAPGLSNQFNTEARRRGHVSPKVRMISLFLMDSVTLNLSIGLLPTISVKYSYSPLDKTAKTVP